MKSNVINNYEIMTNLFIFDVRVYLHSCNKTVSNLYEKYKFLNCYDLNFPGDPVTY